MSPMTKANWSVLFFFLILLAQLLMPFGEPTVQATSPQDDWPMFRHDLGHTGVTSSAGPIESTELWRFAEGHFDGYFIGSSAAVVNDIVYVGSNYNQVEHRGGNVYAFDAYTGAKLWNYSLNKPVYSSPAVIDNLVVFGSEDGSVYALNAVTGAKKWAFPTEGAVNSSPVITNGVVYIGSKDGNLYAINSSTGKGMWNYRTGNSILSSPAVNDEVVYVGSQDHNVYAINTNTGMKIWNYTLGGPVDSSPSIANNTIYVGSNWGAFDNVYALNISTGSKIWSFKTFNGEEKGVTSSPAVDDSRVFIGAQGGGLYALDASSGAQLWNRDEYFILHSSPAVAGGVVYINSDALNASTGETIWSFPTGNLVNASPVVSDGVVYIASQDGYFYAIGEHSHQPFFNIAIIIALVVIGVTITAVLILLYRRKKDT